MHSNRKGQKVCRVWLSKPGGVLLEAAGFVMYRYLLCGSVSVAGIDSRVFLRCTMYTLCMYSAACEGVSFCVCIKVCSVAVGSVGDGAWRRNRSMMLRLDGVR